MYHQHVWLSGSRSPPSLHKINAACMTKNQYIAIGEGYKRRTITQQCAADANSCTQSRRFSGMPEGLDPGQNDDDDVGHDQRQASAERH